MVGVAQAINKKSGDAAAFTEQDEKVEEGWSWEPAATFFLLLLLADGWRPSGCADVVFLTSTGFLCLFGFFGHRPLQRSALRDVPAGEQAQPGGWGPACLCMGTSAPLRLHMLVFVCVQVLLDLATFIFEEQQCLEVLLRKFAGTILSFMQAQACTVFIADQDSMVREHTDTMSHSHTFMSNNCTTQNDTCD